METRIDPIEFMTESNGKYELKTPEVYREEKYRDLQKEVDKEKERQDRIIKESSKYTVTGVILRALTKGDNINKPEFVVIVVIILSEVFLWRFIPDNEILRIIVFVIFVMFPFCYKWDSIEHIFEMGKAAKEEIKRARENQLNVQKICEKRIEEECSAYEARYDEWIKAMKNPNKKGINIIYYDPNQTGDFIIDSNIMIDRSKNTIISIERDKIDYKKLVEQIYSDKEGLNKLIEEIASSGNAEDLSKTLREGKKKDKIAEALANAANLAAVIKAVTGIGTIPELALYAMKIINLIL